MARAIPAELYNTVLHDPKLRDPRGYIIPSDQPDFATATEFVNALLKNGIDIQRATAAFQVAGKSYPAGSYVVKTAQAFRPHVLDMFEPQDHPNDFAYPGGPPNRPYDITGWTLAMQMGVQYDRVLDGFDGPFTKIKGLLPPPAKSVVGPSNPAGYLISHAYQQFVRPDQSPAEGQCRRLLAEVGRRDGWRRPRHRRHLGSRFGRRPARSRKERQGSRRDRSTRWPKRQPAMP